MAKFGEFLSCLFAKLGIIPERLCLLLQPLIYTFKLNLMPKDQIITALPFRFPPLQSRFCRLGVGSNLIQLISYIFHFDEQKDQVAIEQILWVVFLDPKRPCPYQKGHQEALILGGLELISAEMIPFNPWPHCGLIHFDACIHLEVHGISAKSETMNQNSKNYVSGIVEQKNLSEFDMSKLGIGFDDEKSERKTSEKALVLSQINV
ncbi:uncharacterized protein [Gossypium hirsutum]|uniref:Uncharacterized protein isoform X1 n=1 Tax=Gossypium hirsutum TaxID=3635 RepID=A0ABM3AAA4_GOSHI|nr:uncharacterized protein LOC107901797 isoform X1 [Gossypium hirsutum]